MRLNHHIFSAVLGGIICMPQVINAQTRIVSNSVNAIVASAEEKYKGRIGMSVQRLRDDSIIYRNRFTELFTPASIVKVLSTGAVLRKKGASFRFPTEIYMTGSIQNGVLHGNIIIKGGGDPSLASLYIPKEENRFAQELIAALQRSGIKSVTGGIYYDSSLPTGLGQVSGWLAEDKRNHYGAGLFGLNYRDNVLNFSVRLRGKGSDYDVTTTPYDMGIKWSLSRVKGKRGISYTSTMGSEVVTIQARGNVSQSQSFRVPNPSPTYGLAFQVSREVQKAGILLGKSEPIVSYDGYEQDGALLYTYYSKGIDTLSKITNYRSQNFYAEAIGRLLDPSKDKGEALTDYWHNAIKVDANDLWLYDASGLDRRNKANARAFSLALKYLFGGKYPNDGILLETLPEVGKEGTVQKLMQPNKGVKVYLKSGTMRSVSTYVGYVYDGDEWYSIVYLTNGMPGAWASRAVLQMIVHEIWQLDDNSIPL